MGDLLPEPTVAIQMRVFQGGGGSESSEGGARSDLLDIPVERIPLVEFRGGGTVQVGGALADELSGFTFKNVEIFKVPSYDLQNYILVLLEGAWPAQAGGSSDVESVMVGGATPEEARAALDAQKDIVEAAEVAQAEAEAAAAAAAAASARAAVLTPLQEAKEAAKLTTGAARLRYNNLLRKFNI